MTEQISPIEYKGKEIDKGYVIGQRKYRWLLKRNYEPCWARSGNEFVTRLSPHKKDFTVYIPFDLIKTGQEITIQAGKVERKQITITDLQDNFFSYELIEPEQTDCPF